MITALIRQARYTLIFFLLSVTYTNVLYGGLVINISEDISPDQISKIEANNGDLVVTIRGKNHRISLPSNFLENIILWVGENGDGPFIFSIDGGLLQKTKYYIPPSLPEALDLGSVILNYDVYAHQIALGGVPGDRKHHPLINRYGENYMPAQQYQHLLDPNNSNNDALWYRRLTTKFSYHPNAIGELILKALPSENGLPVRVSIISNRWFEAREWYRDVDVASPWDERAFNLPYEHLKNDLETRWDAYREAFKPLDELSSIVEVYSILTACMRKKPDLWNQFLEPFEERNATIVVNQYLNASDSPELSINQFSSSSRSWWEWSISSLTDGIHTTAQADLFLSLVCNSSGRGCFELMEDIFSPEMSGWLESIEELAENSSRLHTKLLLVKALAAEEDADKEAYGRLFLEKTGESMDWFRLRVSGWNLLTCGTGEFEETNEGWENHLIRERTVILNDFIEEVHEHSTSGSDRSMLTWENLLQNIYSTDLLTLAGEEYGYYHDDKFIQAVACVHRHRGLAFQRGLEINYKHANFRFLTYLTDRIGNNVALSSYIESSAEDILNNIDGPGNLEEVRYIRRGPATPTMQVNTVGIVQGTLSSAQQWANRRKRDNRRLVNGGNLPGGLMTGNKFTILLIDAEIFAHLTDLIHDGPVRVSGIIHHDGKSITPFRIEYKRDGTWETYDLPHSGISGPGVLGGDE